MKTTALNCCIKLRRALEVNDMAEKGLADDAFEELSALLGQHEGGTSTVLEAVAQERIRQDGKWGGPSHDDELSPHDFARVIRNYTGWAEQMADMGSMEKARKRFVQVAALAVAVTEAIDRAIQREDAA